MARFADHLLQVHRDDKDRLFAKFRYPDGDGPTVLAEGDSWFEYPMLKSDILLELAKRYRIKSLAKAGDTWQRIEAQGELSKELESGHYDLVLVSMGGNDVVDEISSFVKVDDHKTAYRVGDFLLGHVFAVAVKKIVNHYRDLCRTIAERHGIDVIVSGYDYPDPRQPPLPGQEGEPGAHWIGPVLARENKLWHRRLWHELTHEAIRRLDAAMTRFADDFNREAVGKGWSTRVTFVSQWDAVNEGDHRPDRGVANPKWNDEMHPTADGFRRMAARIAPVIDAAWQRRRGATTLIAAVSAGATPAVRVASAPTRGKGGKVA